MYALAGQTLPEGSEWLYEVKFDGYRCLAGRDKNGVTLWSRGGNLFTSQFSQIAHGCELLKPDTLLDGEIIADDDTGRVSFNLLQGAGGVWCRNSHPSLRSDRRTAGRNHFRREGAGL